MYTCKFFAPHELVYPSLYEQYSTNPNKLYMAFDINALVTLDLLRKKYGPCVINNWKAGGSFKHSGLRPPDCEEGAALSQHKFGRAFDCKFSQVTPAEIWIDIEKNPSDEAFALIRRVERFDGMSWFHFDTGNNMGAGIRFIGAK